MGGLLWSTRVSLRAAHGGLLKQNSGYNGGLLYYAFPYYKTVFIASVTSLAKVV